MLTRRIVVILAALSALTLLGAGVASACTAVEYALAAPSVSAQ